MPGGGYWPWPLFSKVASPPATPSKGTRRPPCNPQTKSEGPLPPGPPCLQYISKMARRYLRNEAIPVPRRGALVAVVLLHERASVVHSVLVRTGGTIA